MATITTQTIKVDLTPGRVYPVLHVSQGDVGLEALEFHIYQNNQPYPIPSQVTTINIDGMTSVGVFSYPCTWSGNVVTAGLTATMTAERGVDICELALYDATNNKIGTCNFVIAVEESPFTNAHVSTSDMATIMAAASSAQQYELLSKSWAVGDTGIRTGEDTNNSEYWSVMSESWAVGDTGKRTGENTNNSEYWSTVSHQYANSISFKTYETVAQMVADTGLLDGGVCRTLGEINISDNLGALYQINTSAAPWAGAESVALSNGLYAVKINEVADYCLIPDVAFSGTDTQKLQACLDALKTTGGVILINREYTLTANLVNKLNTDATNKKMIVMLGIGKNAMLSMGTYSFTSDLSHASIGGLHFVNMDFEGSGYFANTNKLVRLFFNNCRFRGFSYVIYGDDVTQSLYFSQCYFEDISSWVFANISDGVWDVKFSQCICENSNGFYNGDLNSLVSGNYSVVIDQCTIEGMTSSAIIPGANTSNFTVSNSYFEACQPIDLTKCGGIYSSGFDIENNTFVMANGVSAILMPYDNAAAHEHGYVKNNVCVPDTSTLCSISGTPQLKCRFHITDNVGVLDSASKYATYVPVYGEVVELSQAGLTDFAANSDHLIDNTRDYRLAISLSLIYCTTAGSYRNPGTFIYARQNTGELMMRIGEQALSRYCIRVIMPTN